MQDHTDFYKNLEKNNIPLKDLLEREHLFESVPKNWQVIVTDVENSTNAVTEGRHNDVNLTATGSIITVLNTLKKHDPSSRIPYFFGGDGATFIVPQSLRDILVSALEDYASHITKTLDLNLRIGFLEVSEAYAENYTLRIAKLRQNQFLTTPVVLGNALKYAESIIKSGFNDVISDGNSKKRLDLEGMECRWDEIYPAKKGHKVACLLISATSETRQAEVFNEVMNEIDYIFGNLSQRNPITLKKLKLQPTIEKIRKEMYTRIGKFNIAYLFKNWLVTNFGVYYFKFFKSGQLYLYKVTQLSDTIMLDGSINTIITGSDRQFAKLKMFLDTLESKNKIIYGFHKTHASIMSCYVEDRKDKHIHFVDGTEGGYTSAASEYKLKLKRQYISKT